MVSNSVVKVINHQFGYSFKQYERKENSINQVIYRLIRLFVSTGLSTIKFGLSDAYQIELGRSLEKFLEVELADSLVNSFESYALVSWNIPNTAERDLKRVLKAFEVKSICINRTHRIQSHIKYD